MYLVHALIVLCIILKKNDRKGVVCMTNFTVDVSQIVLFIGVMAFIVSIITEALKKWTWFDKKVPTALTVIILSLILCPVCLLGLAAYYGVAIEWFMGNIFGKSIIIIHVKNAHLSYHWLILQYVSYLLGCQIILLCKLL